MIPASDPGKALSLVYTYVPKERILWFCDFGSRAYGTDGPDSDYDYRGIYIADPADVFACTYSAKDNVELHANAEGKKYDIGMWELKKFLNLLAKSNPNAIEIARAPTKYWQFQNGRWASNKEESAQDQMALALKIGLANIALETKEFANTFIAYASAQLFRTERTYRETGQYDFKNLMHVERLVMMCKDATRTGKIEVRRSDEQIQRLLAIKSGELGHLDIPKSRAVLQDLKDQINLKDWPLTVNRDDIDNLYRSVLEIQLKSYLL